MRGKLSDTLQVTWKSFLLEQANSRRGDQWKAWQDPRFTSRDIPPHEAAKSILAEHGEQAFERFHMEVFRAYHLNKRDIANPLELLAIAREVDIDTTVLAEDLDTSASLPFIELGDTTEFPSNGTIQIGSEIGISYTKQ